jgi:alanyl-tRNA synthetase
VNERIVANDPVSWSEVPYVEAKANNGIMALFGEKYGDLVRVVQIGGQPHKLDGWSMELCGGTHTRHTGEIGLFRLVGEGAVAAGVRRIEALTGPAAFRFLSSQLEKLKEVGSILKAADPVKAVEKLIAEKAELEKHVEHLENRALVGIRNELLTKDEIIDGVTFIGETIQVSNADALKKILFDLKNNLHDYLAVLCANIGGKPYVAIGISDTVVQARQLDAGKIIKEHVAPIIRGGGGGQKNLATAGGQDASNLRQVIDTVRSLLQHT